MLAEYLSLSAASIYICSLVQFCFIYIFSVIDLYYDFERNVGYVCWWEIALASEHIDADGKEADTDLLIIGFSQISEELVEEI